MMGIKFYTSIKNFLEHEIYRENFLGVLIDVPYFKDYSEGNYLCSFWIYPQQKPRNIYVI